MSASQKKILGSTLEEQLLLNVNMSLRYIYRTENLSSSSCNFIKPEKIAEEKQHFQEAVDKSWLRTSFIYKQRVKVPPSSISRGKWPMLT